MPSNDNAPTGWTPAPWKVTEVLTGSMLVYREIGPGMIWPICTVTHCEDSLSDDAPPEIREAAKGETKANVRLIRAAPETALERDELKRRAERLEAAGRNLLAASVPPDYCRDNPAFVDGLEKARAEMRAAIEDK